MFNTGNPLPSKDILDLYDNSEVVDNFVNSQQDETPDRFGTKRLTLAGLIKRSMALRNEINDFSGALTFRPEWSDVPMNVSEGVGGEGGALNLQAEALGNRSEINKVTSREALRRSYAEAGYNLVDGSFEAGGTLVNANDVLLQERTGKAFSGPAGTVAAGTNPASGGFVEIQLRYEIVRDLQQLLSQKSVLAKISGIIDISTPIFLGPEDTVSSRRRAYRAASHGLRLTANGSQAVTNVRYASGGRLENLALVHANKADENESVGFNLNVLDTPVETSGIGAVADDVYIKGFNTAVNISGWAWHVRMTRVVTDQCITGFRSRPSSTNLMTFDQCVALLGSQSGVGPLSSTGYDLDGSGTVSMLNCASEANFVNCRFKNCHVTFDVFYSESAAFQDFNLNGGSLTGHTLRVMPSAPKFANSSVFRTDIGALSPRVRITNMVINAGNVSIDAIFDLNEDADIIIDYIDTRDCNYTNLWYNFKKSPRKVGFKNQAGARWYMEKTTQGGMRAVVEIKNFDSNFSFTTPTLSGVKDYKADGARQITDTGTYELVGGVWRNVDSSRAKTVLQNTSAWQNRKVIAGEYYALRAVNFGQGSTGSCYLAPDGAVNGDRVLIVSEIGTGLPCSITVRNREESGTVLATVTEGNCSEFVYDGANWVKIR